MTVPLESKENSMSVELSARVSADDDMEELPRVTMGFLTRRFCLLIILVRLVLFSGPLVAS